VLAKMPMGFKPREERITVLIPSRMRVGAAWMDVIIHNVSSRGLMAGCDSPPVPGNYIEVRRGTIVIVGRVMWSKGRFFGVRTQDRLTVSTLVSEPRLAQRPKQDSDRQVAERRADVRLVHEAQMARRLERSRAFASIFQFVIIALAVVAVAFLGASTLYGVLSAPAHTLNRALAGQ